MFGLSVTKTGRFWGEREQIFNTYCGCWRWRGEVKSIAIYKYSVALLISHDSGVQGYISMFPDTGELLCTEGRGRVHFNQVSFIDLSIPSIKSNHCSHTAIQGWRGDHWCSFEDKRRVRVRVRFIHGINTGYLYRPGIIDPQPDRMMTNRLLYKVDSLIMPTLSSCEMVTTWQGRRQIILPPNNASTPSPHDKIEKRKVKKRLVTSPSHR